MGLLGLSDRKSFRKACLQPAIAGVVELMIVRDEMREAFAGAERKMPLLHALAERVEHGARYMGWSGVEYAVTAEEMRSLGLVMDCGESYKKVCG